MAKPVSLKTAATSQTEQRGKAARNGLTTPCVGPRASPCQPELPSELKARAVAELMWSELGEPQGSRQAQLAPVVGWERDPRDVLAVAWI